jgi:hypothetical protein
MTFKQFTTLAGNHRMQLVSVATALVLVVGVSFIGSLVKNASNAAPIAASTPTIPVNSLALSPASGKVAYGSKLRVTLLLNSGSQSVNAVQAKIDYDPALLAFDGITEGTALGLNAATSTETPGVIRLARATQQNPITGVNDVVTLEFTVKSGVNGTAKLTIDQASSFLARSGDATNILATVSSGTYSVRGR